jgi:hypothetical protein
MGIVSKQRYREDLDQNIDDQGHEYLVLKHTAQVEEFHVNWSSICELVQPVSFNQDCDSGQRDHQDAKNPLAENTT